MMCGGFGQPKPADQDIQALCDEVKAAVECELNTNFVLFEAVNYKTQVVAGINYMIKVKIGENEYAHVKIHKPLPHMGTALQLMEASKGHDLNAAL